MDMRSCAPFTVPFGLSHHSPDRWTSRETINSILHLLKAFQPLFEATLGADESLYAGLSRTWRTHLIFQSQLSGSALWWLRKPFVQAFDFVSGFNRSPQSLVRLVALELVNQANLNLSRKPSGVVTLERPSLRSEGCPADPSRSDEVLRIGCLGHWTRTADFHRLPTWRANLVPTSASKQSVCGLPLQRPLTFRALTARAQRLAPYHLPERVGGGRCRDACRWPARPTISSSAVR